MDRKTASDPLRRRLRRLSRGERAEEARAFVRRFHRENQLTDESRRRREAEVGRALRRFGWYEHTPEEIAFGARMAWRHSSRCIGRLHWKSLDVVDCRNVNEPEGIAASVVQHLESAFNGGEIRSVITIFAPVKADVLPAYIESRQAIQYAGWVKPGSPVVGDPLNIDVTRVVEGLGWAPTSEDSGFQVLPLLIRDANQRRSIHVIPRKVVREVRIDHPKHPAIGDMGIRWYAIPCVSGMILTIGGIDYPCAPFNGHYMGTEIASRNLADERRYDLLPKVAEAIGVEKSENPLWKDQALLTLNEAILDSYQREGVRITDHHTESERYMDFVERERTDGRQPAGDWSWVTPPQAGPACPVFHMKMEDHHPLPNFYRDRGSDGAMLRPDYTDVDRWRHADRWDRFRYRIRRWRHRRDGLRR
jgi:nitric-oxide synthase